MPSRDYPTTTPTSVRSRAALVALSLLATAAVHGTAVSAASAATTATSTTSTTSLALTDVAVREDMPTTDLRASTRLRTDGSPRAASYLRSTVAGHSGPVTKSVLQVYGYSDSGAGFVARPATSAWSQSSATWATRPATGHIIGRKGPTREKAGALLDVTSLVRGDGTVDVAPTSGSRHKHATASRKVGTPKTAPLVGDSITTEPIATEPITTEPITTEPITTEPITTEPITTEPITTEPITTEPIATEPITTEPITPEPIATEPIATEPITPATGATTPAPLHVSPGGGGTRDGSSWGNAGDLTDIPRFVAARPEGGEIWVRGDAGPYRHSGSINIKAGGSATAPVVIRGVDVDGGSSARPNIVGTRTAPYSPTGVKGGEVFKLYSGAKNLTFTNLDFSNEGTAFNAGGNAENITIEDVTATNVRRFFSNYLSSGETTANVSGLTLRRVTVDGFSKAVLRLENDSNRVLIEDVTGDSQRQDGDDFAMGVHLGDTVHDVTLRRVTMRNAHDSLHTYWNGDGFATERGVRDVRFEDTLATGNTDGGYDLKSTRTTLVNARAEDNKRNFRFWAADTTVIGCTGFDPHKRGGSGSQTQVWLGANAAVTLSGCTLEDTSASTIVFDLETGARLTATTTTVSMSPLARLQRLSSGSSLVLE